MAPSKAFFRLGHKKSLALFFVGAHRCVRPENVPWWRVLGRTHRSAPTGMVGRWNAEAHGRCILVVMAGGDMDQPGMVEAGRVGQNL